MQRKWAFIGGGATLVVAGVAATQLIDRPGEPAATAAPPAAVVAPAEESATTVPAASAAAEAAVARLTAALAEEEAENARLRTTLAVRDAVLESLRATVAQRDAALDGLRAELEAGNRRIATLQASVEAARSEPGTFEEAIAALKPQGEASAARLEAARADTDDLDALFAAKTALSAPVPLLVPVSQVAGGDQPSVEVHFDFASAALTPGGVANAAAAAVSLRGMTLERIRLVGHTDRVGSPDANRRLAAKRAKSVAAALISAGVPVELIEIEGLGESDPPVATSDGVPEPMNRSVAIIAVPRTTS